MCIYIHDIQFHQDIPSGESWEWEFPSINLNIFWQAIHSFATKSREIVAPCIQEDSKG